MADEKTRRVELPEKAEPKTAQSKTKTMQIVKEQLANTRTIAAQKAAQRKTAARTFVRNMQHGDNFDVTYGRVSFREIFTAVGQVLYDLGTQTQLLFVRLARLFMGLFHVIGAFFAKYARILARGVLAVCGFFGNVLRDIAGGFAAFGRAVQKAVQGVKKEAKASGKDAFTAGVRYFAAELHKNRKAVRNAAAYLMPTAAAIMLLLIVHGTLSSTYALAVEYNDTLIGFVENENVYLAAQNIVKNRMAQAKNEADTTWLGNASFSIRGVNSNALSSAATLADKLIEQSSDKIINATGITVNGQLYGVVEDGAALQVALDEILAPYAAQLEDGWRAEFQNDVETLVGVYYTDSVTDIPTVLSMLGGAYYDRTVQGDGEKTLADIAEENNISLASLYEMNPDISHWQTYVPTAEETIKVFAPQSLLGVQTVQTVVHEEPLEYETQASYDDTLEWGTEVVQQEGVNGVQRLTDEITYIDGEQVSTRTVSTEVVTPAVEKIATYGTASEYGAVVGQAGSGNFTWPVPDYIYVSRGFGSHRGLDICAPRGTHIYAADSGLVVTAGWHFSYGNYVVIDHGNGFTTLYGHCEALNVQQGDYVQQNQLIAFVGNTGNSFGYHCHFEVTRNGTLVNPDNYVQKYNKSYGGGNLGWWTK